MQKALSEQHNNLSKFYRRAITKAKSSRNEDGPPECNYRLFFNYVINVLNTDTGNLTDDFVMNLCKQNQQIVFRRELFFQLLEQPVLCNIVFLDYRSVI